MILPRWTMCSPVGRFEIISIGFVIALWSGSRALNVVVDTLTIMYGLAGQRSILETRALSFSLYLVFLSGRDPAAAGAGRPGSGRRATAPKAGGRRSPVLAGRPAGLSRDAGHPLPPAVPVRTRGAADLPGAALTLAVVARGSALLRLVLGPLDRHTPIYGPLAAPIAVLVWLYLISLALLVGAAFNASLDPGEPRTASQ